MTVEDSESHRFESNISMSVCQADVAPTSGQEQFWSIYFFNFEAILMKIRDSTRGERYRNVTAGALQSKTSFWAFEKRASTSTVPICCILFSLAIATTPRFGAILPSYLSPPMKNRTTEHSDGFFYQIYTKPGPACSKPSCSSFNSYPEGRGGGVLIIMHSRSRMTIDHRIPTMMGMKRVRFSSIRQTRASAKKCEAP